MYDKYERENTTGARIHFKDNIDKLLYDIQALREFSKELNKAAFDFWMDEGKPKITEKFLIKCKENLTALRP